MGHALPCSRCGWQETPHVYPELLEDYPDTDPGRRLKKNNGNPYRYSYNACPGYSDGIRHLAICPGRKYCAGNCKYASDQLEWQAQVQENRLRNVAMLVSRPGERPRLVFVDMGS